MDIWAVLAVGIVAALLWRLIGHDERRYEVKRGWRLPDKWE